MRFSCLVAALLLLAAQPPLAQEPVATRPTAPPVPVVDSAMPVVSQQGQPQLPPSCWRARRQCKTFFLTDIGYEWVTVSTTHTSALAGAVNDFRGRLVWTLGVMGTSGKHSHGAAASIVSDEWSGTMPFTLEYRYRTWLTESQALDAGIGYKHSGFGDPVLGNIPRRGVTSMVAFTPNRWIGVNLRGDFVRAGGRDQRALFVGLHSTRLSEEALKLTLIVTLKVLLERIGIDTNDEE